MKGLYASAMSMMADRLCMISPDKEGEVETCLRALAELPDGDKLMFGDYAHDDYWGSPEDWRSAYKPYIVKDGILHIPVRGVLLHDYPYQVGKYATGYYYIQKAMERGLSDPAVRGIALVCNSPGGTVAGCFELVDRIYAAREVKPIRAFAHEAAYSAAYAVASAGQQITVSRTGGVGSIGVVRTHIDLSKLYDDAGVKITFIYAGSHKVDGNPYEKLAADVKKRWQGEIDETYGVFVSSVARNRGMSENDVRSTEALTFTATDAVNQGLADNIGPFDDALADFVACLSCGDEGDEAMTDKTKAADEQAQNDQAVKDAATKAAAEGRAEERKRISAIKGLDEAKTRPAAAESVAMNTEMSVEAAKAFLATLPEEAKPTEAKAEDDADKKTTNSGESLFQKVMDSQPEGPGANVQDESSVDEDDKIAARLLAARFGPKDAKAAAA